MAELDEEVEEIFLLRKQILDEQTGKVYFTSENPKVAELIQKAKD